MTKNFTTINVVDFEYETSGGEFNLVAGDLPSVLCMVVYVLNEILQLVRIIRMWRGAFGKAPPFDTGTSALFVAYSAWAEMTSFIDLGWEFPEHIFDQHTAYLAASNILLPYNPDEVRKRQRKGLPDACRAYGIEGWDGSTRRSSPKISAKDVGVITARRRFTIIAKRTSRNLLSCCARN